MLIKVVNSVAGENSIERNKNRRSLILGNKNNANNLINKLYSSRNESEFKNVLTNEVLYELISDDLISKLYKSKLTSEQFLEWYTTRGQEGFWDLIKRYKLYEEW